MTRVTLTLPTARDNADMDGHGYLLTLDGLDLHRGFTPETDRAQVERFAQLCEAQADALKPLLVAYEEKLAWNNAQVKLGKWGKPWPEFSRLEKFLNQLQKQAGIIDT